MDTRPPRILTYDGEPEATIQHTGRWTYWVSVTWGITAMGEHGGWHVLGRKRAERSARRAMAKWKAERNRETWKL